MLPEFYPESYGQAGRQPPGGGDDDDDGGEDYDDEDEEEAVAAGDDVMESDESDNETDMVVLDPEHVRKESFVSCLKKALGKNKRDEF